MTLRQLEWKAFLDLRADRDSWQVMRFAWAGDYDDAGTFTGLFVSGGENNLPGYADPRYDDLLRRAAAEADPAVRAALLAAPCFGEGSGPLGHTLGEVPLALIHNK